MSDRFTCIYHKTLDRYDGLGGYTSTFETGDKGLAEYVSSTTAILSKLQQGVRAMQGFTPRMPIVVAGGDGVPLVTQGLDRNYQPLPLMRDIAVSTVLEALMAHLKLSPYVDEAALGHPVKFKKVEKA
jgi:hypothetical protein